MRQNYESIAANLSDKSQLRQAIEKQLNKGENANQFSKAISFGNHHAFLYGEKVAQELAEGCRRLIKNAIICWNYFYLSQKIGQEQDAERQQALLAAVQQSTFRTSLCDWSHFCVPLEVLSHLLTSSGDC